MKKRLRYVVRSCGGGLAVREVQGQSVYKRQVAEEVKTDIDEGNGDMMDNNTVLTD